MDYHLRIISKISDGLVWCHTVLTRVMEGGLFLQELVGVSKENEKEE